MSKRCMHTIKAIKHSSGDGARINIPSDILDAAGWPRFHSYNKGKFYIYQPKSNIIFVTQELKNNLNYVSELSSFLIDNNNLACVWHYHGHA